MTDSALNTIRALIQHDVNHRGLRGDSANNLITACPDDFRHACVSLATHPGPSLAIVTGFYIPNGQPPGGETDGPLGAVFLARALRPFMPIVIATDDFCVKAVQAGLNLSGLRKDVPVVTLPTADEAGRMTFSEYCRHFQERAGIYTHLLAIERAGPSHTRESLRSQTASEAVTDAFLEMVTAEHHDRCHTMRGRDISSAMSPAFRLFENVDPTITTIGIGDGGNEIGMGKIAWGTICKNIPGGGQVACRVPTRHLIVAGISNWGAYGLAAGVSLLRGVRPEPSLYNSEREFEILEAMVEAGPLVDGVTGLATPTVDGLHFDRYAEVLTQLGQVAF